MSNKKEMLHKLFYLFESFQRTAKDAKFTVECIEHKNAEMTRVLFNPSIGIKIV